MNSAPTCPQRLPRLTRPIRLVDPIPNPNSLSNYDPTEDPTPTLTLPANPYGLDLHTTRKLVSDLSSKVNALQNKLQKMQKSHAIFELETQMQVYTMSNIIKDYEEYMDGAIYAAKCDATYYLHKYMLKKKMLQDHVPPQKKKKRNSRKREHSTNIIEECQKRDVHHLHVLKK